MIPTLHKNPKYKQGYYKPINPLKYIGKYQPIFRSGLELKFFLFLDKNENVVRWSSEAIAIPYFDSVQRKMRKYYLDNYVEIQEGPALKKYLIEVKPYKQTQEPVNSKGRKKKHLIYEQLMWVNNSQDKWPAARAFAKTHGMEFLIITDKDIEGKT